MAKKRDVAVFVTRVKVTKLKMVRYLGPVNTGACFTCGTAQSGTSVGSVSSDSAVT